MWKRAFQSRGGLATVDIHRMKHKEKIFSTSHETVPVRFKKDPIPKPEYQINSQFLNCITDWLISIMIANLF